MDYPTELDRDAVDLHNALSELVRVYQFRDRKSICCYDISVTQCYVLEYLVDNDASTLRQLAEAMFLDNSTASRVVDALERKGYVLRASDPLDGRATRLAASEEGVRLHDKIESELIETEKALLEDIAPEVRQATTKLIARLARTATTRFTSTTKL
jgi:MarR family 2-MHQ and catechol resistance regulon transcriptional repressor